LRRLRVDVVKNSMTADSSNDGEFETSTTTDAALEGLSQALASEGVDARVWRCRHGLMALLPQSAHEL